MTKQEYINHIVELYRIANNSDTERRESWINPFASADHCQTYDDILIDLSDDFEHYETIMSTI